MGRAPLFRQPDPLPHREVVVDIVIPVYNEERALADSVRALRAYLDCSFPYRWSIVVADNASTDGTRAIAEALCAEDDRVRLLHLTKKGRGRALRLAWGTSTADIVAYMDVDLSTNLAALLPLIAPIATGHSELAIGSRLLRGAVVTRQWKRELISRGYNLMIRALFWNRFSDAQCGFKAARRAVVAELLADVTNNAWFFDTELLLLAEERGLRIAEVPVEWIEDLDSRVKIVATAVEDIRGLLRVRRGRAIRARSRA